MRAGRVDVLAGRVDVLKRSTGGKRATRGAENVLATSAPVAVSEQRTRPITRIAIRRRARRDLAWQIAHEDGAFISSQSPSPPCACIAAHRPRPELTRV